MNNTRPKVRAFTLVELLVVVAIMGVLMSIAIPGFKKLRRQDPLSLGAQQMLDDLEWARIHAMARGADVYMVFFPLWNQVGTTPDQDVHFKSSRVANALLGGQCGSYAIFAEGSAGEQPGQPLVEQTFLVKWRRLPLGVVVPSAAFNNNNINAFFHPTSDVKLPFLANDDPVPAASTNSAGFGTLSLPAIRFRARGDLNVITGVPVLTLYYYGASFISPPLVSYPPLTNSPPLVSLPLVSRPLGLPVPYPLTNGLINAHGLANVQISPAVPNPRRAVIEVSGLSGRSKLISIQP